MSAAVKAHPIEEMSVVSAEPVRPKARPRKQLFTGTREEAEACIRELDRMTVGRGWHDTADSGLYYVLREGGRLTLERAKLPNLDRHPEKAATEILYELAQHPDSPVAFPSEAVGAAWTMEAFQAQMLTDPPVIEGEDEGIRRARVAHHRLERWLFFTAQQSRTLNEWHNAAEVRTFSLVLRNGQECAFVRERSGATHLIPGPGAGLVSRALRLLLGLPEGREDAPRPKDWELE